MTPAVVKEETGRLRSVQSLLVHTGYTTQL